MHLSKPSILLSCLALPIWCSSNSASAKPAPTGVKLTFAHGPEVLLNDGWYEGNKDAYGFGVTDNYPDYKAGDRMAPGELVEGAALHLNGSGTGRWKLIFPRQIKVWIMINGKLRQVMSGAVSAAVALPRTVKLQIEGIELGQDIRIAAVLQLPSGTKFTGGAAFTVFSGGVSVTGGAEAPEVKAAREAAERQLALWPPCRPTD